MNMLLLQLLAQGGTPPASQPATPPGVLDIFQGPMLLVLLFIVVFFWLNARSRKKEQQKFEEMLNSLKRNDRVLTIGGIIGTVVDTRENEVILKVDEGNNTKLRFNRSAIKELVHDAGGASESK